MKVRVSELLVITLLISSLLGFGVYTDQQSVDRNRENYSSELSLKDLNKERREKSIHFQDNFDFTDNAIIIDNKPGLVFSNHSNLTQTIVVKNSPGAVIENNTILNNNMINATTGIFLFNSPNSYIQNNIISNNTSAEQIIGISVVDSHNTIIENNTIDNSNISDEIDLELRFAVGISILNSSYLMIRNNTISKLSGTGSYGIRLSQSENSIVISNNVVELGNLPSLEHGEVAGIVLNEASNTTVENNVINRLVSIGNSTAYQWGITAYYSTGLIVHSNNISDLYSSANYPEVAGIDLFSTSSTDISENTIIDLRLVSSISEDAYATGIYFAFSNLTDIISNEVASVFTSGRASYGIFSDYSHGSLIFDNRIHGLDTFSDIRSISIGIGFRYSYNIQMISNIVEDISSDISTVLGPQEDVSTTSIGLTIDYGDNYIVFDNTFLNISGSSPNDHPVDSLGTIIAHSNNIDLIGNRFEKLSSFISSNSITAGLILWDNTNLNIQNVIIENVNSIFQANGIVVLNGENNALIDISVTDVNSQTYLNGISIQNVENILLKRIEIKNLVSPSEVRPIHVLNVMDAYLSHNNILQLNGSRNFGIYISLSSSIYINYNTFHDVTDWMYRNEATDIYCNNNYVNGSLEASNCDEFQENSSEINNSKFPVILLPVALFFISRIYKKSRKRII